MTNNATLAAERPERAPTRRQVPWARPVLWGNESRYAREAVESTHWSAGPFLERLETEFAARHDLESCLAVSNGTAALHLPFLALGLAPQDEVIITGWGFGAAANMVRLVGAIPVFCDVDSNSWVATAATIEAVLSPRTRAVVVIHNYGVLSPMTEIRALLEGRSICVIEDCAESVFSRLDGRYCGSFGDVGTWSLQATKTISCGEGGIVSARDPELTERMRLFRSHGMTTQQKYVHVEIGHNFRLTNLQAAVAVAQLEQADTIIAKRRELYLAYRAGLEKLPVRLQACPAEVAPVMWGLGLELDKTVRKGRSDVMRELDLLGIETRPGFVAYSAQPHYAAASLPVADRLTETVFSLPFPADLTPDEFAYVIDSFAAVLA